MSGSQLWAQLPRAPPILSYPKEPTSPSGPCGHKSQEAFLLEDDAAANEEAGHKGQAQADVEAIVLPDPLLPAVQGGIVGHLMAEATDDLTQDFLGGAVETDQGTWMGRPW